MDSVLRTVYLVSMLAGILLGEFPTCLGVYEYIPNNNYNRTISNPYFDTAGERNVTSYAGQTTHLHCVVKDLGDRMVSWIRKSDLHVLTSGFHTFTGDERFSAHSERIKAGGESWVLQIKYTQLRDAGEYQCQVNTEPKISSSVFLKVSEAKARIEGPDDKEVHVKQRSRVKLTCVVDLGRGHGQDSAAVFWYLDGKALDWLGQTGPGRGVQVTEKRDQQLISTLYIEKADMHHAGKFTCSPSYAKPDTVTLHVIDGESRAELQGNHATSSMRPRSSQMLFSYFKGRTNVFMSFLNAAFNALIVVSIIVSSSFAPLFLFHICPLGRNQFSSAYSTSYLPMQVAISSSSSSSSKASLSSSCERVSLRTEVVYNSPLTSTITSHQQFETLKHEVKDQKLEVSSSRSTESLIS